MNLGKRVIQQLEQLANKGPKQIDAVILNTAQQGYIVGIPTQESEPSAAITLEAYDRYSVTLRQIEVNGATSTAKQGNAEGDLRRWTEQAIRRLNYLEEPLALLELDPTEKLAQLRSDPPYQEEDQVTYWELFIRAEPRPSLKLNRYSWQSDKQERVQVVYPATFATVARIAQDLALSLMEE